MNIICYEQKAHKRVNLSDRQVAWDLSLILNDMNNRLANVCQDLSCKHSCLHSLPENSFEDLKHRNHGSTWGPKLVHTHKHTHTLIQEITSIKKDRVRGVFLFFLLWERHLSCLGQRRLDKEKEKGNRFSHGSGSLLFKCLFLENTQINRANKLCNIITPVL